MTYRERLEEIVNKFYICGSNYCNSCADCEYREYDDYCLNKMLVDKLLAEGFTFKKKREYTRKSPCKCGANARWVIDWSHSYGNHIVACRKCGEQVISNNKQNALIEWNKMNEVEK